MTSVQEDSSIQAPTPNMFSLNYGPSTSIATTVYVPKP